MYIRNKISILISFLIFVLSLVSPYCCFADEFEFATAKDFQLGKIFNDNMVFQQNEPIRIWGTSDDEGGIINARIGEASGYSKVKNGKWEISFASRIYSNEPFTVEIFGGEGCRYETIENARVGDVWWIIGQSNIEYSSSCSGYWETFKEQLTGNENIRLLDLDINQFNADNNIRWRNLNRFSAADASALACFTMKNLDSSFAGEVPLAAVISGYSGKEIASFMPSELTEDFSAIKDESDIYDATIKHFVRMPVKGIIWYQGEADASQYSEYSDKLSSYIEWLRKKKNQENKDFPVYAVELSPCFNDINDPNRQFLDFGIIRGEMGALCAKLENFYVCPTSDTWSERGFSNNLHPDNKQNIAMRLSNMILAKEYGFGDYRTYAGPMLKKYELSDDEKCATLTFDANLVCDNFEGFKIIGKNWDLINNVDFLVSDNILKITSDREICIVRYNVDTENVFGETIFLSSQNGQPAPGFAVEFSTPKNPVNYVRAYIKPVMWICGAGIIIVFGVVLFFVIKAKNKKKQG